jgi:transcription antitermination factor NusG
MAAGFQWVVVQTQPNRERWAAENVARQGREFYLPQIEIMRGAAKLIRPLFSRYLFVRIFNGQWRFLSGTWGVSGIISFARDGTPDAIADKHIDEIRAREDSTGLVRLPAIEDFVVGQNVRVRAGLLDGQIGIYEGLDPRGREKVLLSLLGQKTVVLFAHTDLEVP